MSQYELIAFDMDGTLLNSQKEITPRTLAALKSGLRLWRMYGPKCRP